MDAVLPPLSGTVYGVVLNEHASLARLGAALDDAPYKAPPQAPVLYIKPANTLAGEGAMVRLPDGAAEVEVGATVGVLIGRDTARAGAADALNAVSAYLPVADLSLPHASYYRPAIREKCFDGACPLGSPVCASAVSDVAGLVVCTRIDGELVASRHLDDLVRPVAELIADVSEFMTLRRGDVLLVGVPWQAPRAPAGARVRVEVEGLGAVAFSIAGGAQ